MCALSRPVLAAFVAASLSALSFGFPQASVPTLRHATAPFLGQVLTLEVEGATPLAPIQLYFSPAPGSYATPFGVLELKRDRLELLASGTASAAGTWSFDFGVPLDEALAETGAHFQALVDDPAAPAGRTFSGAVHARFLGPRVYAEYRSRSSPHRIGTYVLSAVSEQIVARVDYGLTDEGAVPAGEGDPVFDAAFSRGAVMSTGRELVLFDPFFGGILGKVTFHGPCSRKLLADASGHTVYVLEFSTGSSPARIHAIEMASGSETAHLDLPNAVTESLWCLGDSASEIFVAEIEPGFRTAVRWVGLDPLVDRGSTRVGHSTSNTFSAMVYEANQVFVSTMGPAPFYFEGSLSRCRTTPSGIGSRVMSLGYSNLYTLAAVPAADRLLAGQMLTDMGPAGWLSRAPLASIAPPTSVPPPPTGGELYVHDIAVDDQFAWIVAASEWQHPAILYRFDLQTDAWTQYPYLWPLGRKDAEVVRDALVHELWVANEGFGPPIDIPAEILVVDELHGTSSHIPLAHTAESLHAVPLP